MDMIVHTGYSLVHVFTIYLHNELPYFFNLQEKKNLLLFKMRTYSYAKHVPHQSLQCIHINVGVKVPYLCKKLDP